MAYINRRRFLQTGSAFGFLAGAGALTGLNGGMAHAADTSGYKALVCLFMFGGMDHADTILPYDQSSYNQLRSVRPELFGSYEANSALSSRNLANILELTPSNAADFGGRQFGLPTQLSPLHSLFQSGDLAIIGNVGPLIEPTTRTEMNSNGVDVPDRLFSHNDQQSTWLALGVEGTRYGWGGRFVDAAVGTSGATSPVFSSVSASGTSVFLSGEDVRQYQIGNSGAKTINYLTQGSLLRSGRNDADLLRNLEEHFRSTGFTADNYFAADIAAGNTRGIDNNKFFSDVFDGDFSFTTSFPDTGLGRQLESVAKTIRIQNQLNVSRQVFFTSTGGFDTHAGQANSLPDLHTNVAASIMAFNDAMREMGMYDSVTLFTGSDFGRTTIDNGDGTDHGWGGHHFVTGGAVKGGQIYGDLPDYDVNAEHYTRSRGRLIPSVSVEQYAATLGRWFGLSNAELLEALPNLANFNEQDLGFMGGVAS